MKLKLVISLTGILMLYGFTMKPSTDTTTGKEDNRSWVLGPFVRPEGANPVISPQPTSFYCPMQKQQVKWEESDTFNPAATVKDGKIVVLYRAEDNSARGIGKRTSRIGYAESTDGVTMTRLDTPVLFPAEDNFKGIEWPGGCEDPRVAMTEDGLYVMLYTAWNRKTPRIAVATSRDLKNWTKHGLAFEKAYDGRFTKIASKSASILTKVKKEKLVIDKVDGKYFMYWGEYAVHAATSDNLVDWYPVLDEKNELKKLARPRKGHFDCQMTECGPPAIRTKKGIVLLYNGKNLLSPFPLQEVTLLKYSLSRIPVHVQAGAPSPVPASFPEILLQICDLWHKLLYTLPYCNFYVHNFPSDNSPLQVPD